MIAIPGGMRDVLVGDPQYADVLKQMRSRCDALRDELGGPFEKHEPRPKKN